MYTKEDVLTYCLEEDVKFIRLAFCDVTGKQKNLAIMPGELNRAFEEGIPFETINVEGFEEYVASNLFLHPDPATLSLLPWRPSNGRVVRMFCDITYPDGTPFEMDGRYLLKQAIQKGEDMGITCYFSNESEFYLLKTDEDGNPTKEPFDHAGYLDIAPEDKGENVRREICFTLYDMGIIPESSHHERGPSQHQVNFKYADALTSAENAITFQSVVKTIAMRYGLYADFGPKPFKEHSGNGMHINVSIKSLKNEDCMDSFMAGILLHIEELTAFLNPAEESYKRFGEKRAPIYISWSKENRNQLLQMPYTSEERKHFKLRSPDNLCNPYVAYALLIYAGLDGVEQGLQLEEATNVDLAANAQNGAEGQYKKLPTTVDAAKDIAKNSPFIKAIFGESSPYLK